MCGRWRHFKNIAMLGFIVYKAIYLTRLSYHLTPVENINQFERFPKKISQEETFEWSFFNAQTLVASQLHVFDKSMWTLLFISKHNRLLCFRGTHGMGVQDAEKVAFQSI